MTHVTMQSLQPVTIKLGANGTNQNISGRGNAGTGITFPLYQVEPLVWWFEQIKWSASNDPEGTTLPSQHQTTYLELAIKFESVTGTDIEAKGWQGKAN